MVKNTFILSIFILDVSKKVAQYINGKKKKCSIRICNINILKKLILFTMIFLE
jgi:hypothetical protein